MNRMCFQLQKSSPIKLPHLFVNSIAFYFIWFEKSRNKECRFIWRVKVPVDIQDARLAQQYIIVCVCVCGLALVRDSTSRGLQ